MTLSLVVVLCHALADIAEPVCVTEIIPDMTIQNFLMAGKADDPHQMPWTPQFCAISAQEIIVTWLKEISPKYIDWYPGRPQCLDGFEDPHRA